MSLKEECFVRHLDDETVDIRFINTTEINDIVILAAEYKKFNLLRQLIDGGYDVNTKTVNGDTALQWAAANGDVKMVNMLLSYPSINLNDVDVNGESALTFAVVNEQYDVALLLITHGADYNLQYDVQNGSPRSILSFLRTQCTPGQKWKKCLNAIDDREVFEKLVNDVSEYPRHKKQKLMDVLKN
jgi:ankyrin repeat protein